MQDVPRLSTVLRQRLGGEVEQFIPLDEQCAARARELINVHIVSGASSSEGTLDWHAFAGPVFSFSGNHDVSQVRQSFLKLLTSANDFSGSDDDRGAAVCALTIYRHFARRQVDTSMKSTPLDRTGCIVLSDELHVPVDSDSYRKLGELVHQLHSWRSRNVGGQGTLDPLLDSNVAPIGSTVPVNRVGLGIVFRAIHSALSAPAIASGLGFPFSVLSGVSFARSPLEAVAEDTVGASARATRPLPALPPTPHSSDSSARPMPGGGGRADAVWLFAQCAQFVFTAASALSPLSIGTGILDVFKKHPFDEGMQQALLFDLLGEAGFEFMGTLMESRSNLASLNPLDFKRIAAAVTTATTGAAESSSGELGRAGGPRRPTMGPGVTVQRAEDVRADKARRKAERKMTRAARTLADAELEPGDADEETLDALEALGFNADYLAVERALGLQGGEVPLYGRAGGGPALAGRGGQGGGWLISADEAIAAVGAGYGGTQKRTLPVGTKDETFEGWREVCVPAARQSATFDPSRLVAVAHLEGWAQDAFKGIKHLNRLQSELFEAAYRSNENLLVCAPTGAGKTNVAMLAVCHELAQHILEGGATADAPSSGRGGSRHRFRDKDFKIVYVAPMKALAQEVVAKFGERLSGLGISVRELTGDMQLTKKEIAETQVIVTTPEKWDVITRKSGDGSLVSLVRLLIIDEVHLLADSRGAVIESLVARTLRQVETSQSIIRIVGLSATLPNYEDVAMFLRVNPQKGLFYFNETYRPVPLQQTFIGVTEVNQQKKMNLMTKITYDKALAAISRGKQVMVFVHSRKDTAKTARSLRELSQLEGTTRMLSPMSGVEAEDVEGLMSKGAPFSAQGGADNGGSTRIQGESRLHLNSSQWLSMQRDIEKSRNVELRELYPAGFGIHHAGMLRSDRALAERMFSSGVTKILVCTATLAWGVNLPAHTVIIKGTQVYDAQHGGFNDLGILDVMQIFGRAGRPQFDTSGEGIIVTSGDKLPHYLSLLTSSVPIESNFIKALPDHLNAEIVSGTVTNVREAIIWLSYTYLFVRMLRNPIAYGIPLAEKEADPLLDAKRLQLITQAAQRLDECRMIRFDPRSGNLAVTDIGRVASHYYVGNDSIATFNGIMEKAGGPGGSGLATDGDVLDFICHAHEFTALKVREEELGELDYLRVNAAPVPLKGDMGSTVTKVNVLMQAYISGAPLRSFTLISDTNYVTQSAGRIARALFEICMRKGWSSLAERLLTICKALDKRLWWAATPLRQFNTVWLLQPDVLNKIEESGYSLDRLCDLGSDELGALVRHPKLGPRLTACLGQIPYLHCEVEVQPITRSILRLRVRVYPDWEWVDRLNGTGEPWWMWVEDATNEHIYHSEYLVVGRKQLCRRPGVEYEKKAKAEAGVALAGASGEGVQVPSEGGGPIELVFTIPIFEPMPSQYWLRCVSDRWLSCESSFEIPFRHLILPDRHPPHTDLLDLMPLSRSALHNPGFESFYSFSHFNPVQTQIFHTSYNTDVNVLVGAPTGSGKTVTAELAIFRLFNAHPGAKAVYIAPLKALVSERIKDWTAKFGPKLTAAGGQARRVVELTGDVTPDIAALQGADIIVTTPEKWDGVSRAWQKRQYVQRVGLIIIDEIHLLGEDRGSVLEVIVSRMRYIAAHMSRAIRFVGLSTALANPGDLADWLGIPPQGVFNFRPSVRPIPMEVHIQGFPGKHYCPRMASMNKPAFSAIQTYSPDAPVLIFVSSRRQTRLTALDLIALCAGDDNPRRFVRMPDNEATAAVDRAKDSSLKHTLAFGIGLHHAGLPETDRSLVEELFCAVKIQVLVCTSTLAWGVNFPAHLVVVKGTEYFDAPTSRYVDYPITDVLQMMGRAGRPQFDTQGVSVILVHEPKKNFYKKFLYEPFPVESHLKGALVEHINAEIAGGTIKSTHDAVEYLTWTYMFRRLVRNPTYYGLQDSSTEAVRAWLYGLIEEMMKGLHECGCIARGLPAAELMLETSLSQAVSAGPRPVVASRAAEAAVAPLMLGHIASYYYVSPSTVRLFSERLPLLWLEHGVSEPEYPPHPAPPTSTLSVALAEPVLRLLCDAAEFAGLPVRHNEDGLNGELASLLPWSVPASEHGSPHVKAFLLLQARFTGAPLPISDYVTDTKTVLDNAVRVMNALVDVAGDAGLLPHALSAMRGVQCIVQARMPDDHPLLQLPYMEGAGAEALLGMLLSGRLPLRPGFAGNAGNAFARAFEHGLPSLLPLIVIQDEPLMRELVSTAGLASAQAVAFLRVVRQLPVAEVCWAITGAVGDIHSGQSVAQALAVEPGVDLTLTVTIAQAQGCTWGRRSYAPRFAKSKDYGWWLVLGNEDGAYSGKDGPETELVALRRASGLPSAGRPCQHVLRLSAPRRPGPALIHLHLVSDCMAGLDQVHAIYLNVADAVVE